MRRAGDAAIIEKVDLIVIAGDTFDGPIHNSDKYFFDAIVEEIRLLADIAPVVVVYGTTTHDIEGSLAILTKLRSKFGIIILEPGQEYFLLENGNILTDRKHSNQAKALLFGVPEPSKKWLQSYFDEKTAAETAVRDGLRSLFLGLGGIRKQYPSLPCVLLYHGQVGGARLQTGDILDNASGMRPSIDDLSAVGADYIAMGDIHEPQHVGESIGLPAYYPGSAYPVDFGETHDAGCNLVDLRRSGIEFDTWCHYVTRVSFGHPINQTVRVKLIPTLLGDSQIDKDLKKEVHKGSNVKLEITCTKEEYAALDLEAFHSQLIAAGAHPDSRVTPNVLPTETVRAGEIIKHSKLRDKVTFWGQNSSKATPETLLLKADEIESEAQSSGAIARDQKIMLTRLVLRGAKGLWKKSRLEEVDIDLEAVEPGLLALIGGNGAGKTTLIENMHPWPCLLTRDGTLKDQFRLKDSRRELYWIDLSTGTRFRARILINAAIASGTTEYYLDFDAGNGWEPMPGITGRKEAYVEAIDKIFGSRDLYLRSAFVTQRQPKAEGGGTLQDLGDATAGERKSLFSALCGLGHFEVYKGLAKSKGDARSQVSYIKEAELSLLVSRIPDQEEIEREIVIHGERIQANTERLTSLEGQGRTASREVDDIKLQDQGNRQKIMDSIEAERLAVEAKSKIDATEASLIRFRESVAKREEAEKTVKEFDQLTADLATENEAYQKHLEALAAEQKIVDEARKFFEDGQRAEREKFETARQNHFAEVQQAREKETRAQAEWQKAKNELSILEQQRTYLERDLAKPVDDHCPTCAQLLPEERREHVLAERQKIQEQLDDLKAKIELQTKTVDDFEGRFKASTLERAATESAMPTAPSLPPFVPPKSSLGIWNDARREGLKADLYFIEIQGARATLEAATEAGVRIEELSKQLIELQAVVIRERQRKAALEAELVPDLENRLKTAEETLQALRTQYQDTQKNLAVAEADLVQARRQLEAVEKDRLTVEALKTALQTLQAEIAEWRLLEFACSEKGIQALELDAVVPTIAAVSNGLLRDSFGSRYQIEFETTQLSGTGKAQKQIETFLIFILDTETGERQEISTLSGGEAVWIRRALYDAFGLIRARTNIDFLTVFMDEADGALDPVQKLTYFRMLQAAHRQAGRQHTIIITHSTELQAMIANKIVVGPRKGECVLKFPEVLGGAA
jgi:exonuclease SbcC